MNDSTQVGKPLSNQSPDEPAGLWCSTCARPVSDPLVCRDCSSIICRICGTALESADELSFG